MFAQIKNHITSSKKIVVTRHVRPDPDAYCSQAALTMALRKTFPDKLIYATGDVGANIKELFEMDKINDDVFEDALVIILDTANKARIADQRFTKGKLSIKVDHHPLTNDEFGDIKWVDTNYSSTAEMVWELIQKCDLEADDEIAKLIYIAIWADTGRFLFPNTNGNTFSTAAMLVNDYNIDLSWISEWFSSLRMDVMKLKGHILQNHNFEDGVAWMVLTQEDLKKFNTKIGDVSQIIGLFSECKDVRIWLIATQEETGEYRVNIRSKMIVINEVAERYQGGGHIYASGARLKNTELVNKIINELKLELKQQSN